MRAGVLPFGMPEHDPRVLPLQAPISRSALIAYLSRTACASSERAERMRAMAEHAPDPVMKEFLRLQAQYHQMDNSAMRMLEAAVESGDLPVAPPVIAPVRKPWWRRVIFWVR